MGPGNMEQPQVRELSGLAITPEQWEALKGSWSEHEEWKKPKQARPRGSGLEAGLRLGNADKDSPGFHNW